jgi:hypothetical protein
MQQLKQRWQVGRRLSASPLAVASPTPTRTADASQSLPHSVVRRSLVSSSLYALWAKTGFELVRTFV